MCFGKPTQGQQGRWNVQGRCSPGGREAVYSATGRGEVIGTGKDSGLGAQTCTGQPGVFIGCPRGSPPSTWDPRICPHDGQFRVSAWLGYSTQLSNQTLIEVLRSDFVAVVHIYHQLTSSKEVTFHNVGGPHPISRRA